MGILTIVVAVIVLITVFNLRERVRKLEQKIEGSAISSVSATTSSPVSIQREINSEVPASLLNYIRQQIKQGVNKEEVKSALIGNGWQASEVDRAFNSMISSANLTDTTIPSVSEPSPSGKFVEWLKEEWLLKLGALLLLIGFGWLTTYAFLHNWIGAVGRITLGIIAGSLFLLLGWWRIKKYLHQGSIFLVLGSTTILLTTFAGREIYDFFSPISALVIMFLSTASIASLILAGVAPLLTSSPNPDFVGLFSYLLVVVLGTVWVVVLTGRRELTTIALIMVALYSLPHIFEPSSYSDTLLIFAYAFATIFFLTNTIGILKLKDKNIIPDLITAAGNGIFLLVWIMNIAPEVWRSLIISAWMVVFAVGAFVVQRASQRRETFYIYAGVGVAMLAAATSAELKGATLTIAYTIECAVISLVTYFSLKDVKVAEKISLLFSAPVVLSFSSITSRAWETSIFQKDFFVLFILGATLLGLGYFFYRRLREKNNKESQQLYTIMLILGSAYAYTLLWLSLHVKFPDSTAVMISLVVYTIIGLICYFYGLSREKKGLRLYGGVLVGLVVGRLVLVDVWQMEMAGKIITFFLIGAMLMSTAFLSRKKPNQSLPNQPQ